mgnify:CR=1 FL=1
MPLTPPERGIAALGFLWKYNNGHYPVCFFTVGICQKKSPRFTGGFAFFS